MRRWLREPLLHFVLLGIILFAVDAFLRERTVEAGGGEIFLSPGRIENLAALFAKTWQRPPTAEELRGLVDDYVLEEALYREGMALGIDRDDTIIRRRVRQKMEFVVDDVVELAEPTEAELETWMAERAESYAQPGRFTFRQVYLNADRRADALQADAERLLAELRSTTGAPDARELGDASLLAHAFEDTGADIVARNFGQAFADRLSKLPIGEWSGPIESPFGLHLALVDARTEGNHSTLAEVRDAVERDWSYAQREEASKRFYEDVLARYSVSIEWPQDDPAGEGAELSGAQE